MSAPTRSGTRSPANGLPVIPRRSSPAQRPSNERETERKEREQVQFLIWRLGMFLKDAGASKDKRKAFHDDLVGRWARGATYEEMCRAIEDRMNGFLAQQVKTIQAIYNEK